MTKKRNPFAEYGTEAPPSPEEIKAYEAKIKACKAEVERRRQIGLTIDPATAETTFWWADIFNPYRFRNMKEYGQIGREHFARHPGADDDDWVLFDDLPEATREALWARDKRKLTFPYGLHPDDDVINYPPGHKEKLLSE